MKLCIAPQSSEHWPWSTPATSWAKRNVLSLPGIASSFRPEVGAATAWITSAAVRRIELELPAIKNMVKLEDTACKSPICRSELRVKSMPSIDQYHCTPKISREEKDWLMFPKAPATTNELRNNTPRQGIIKLMDSSFLELVEEEIFCKSELNKRSLAERIKNITAKKATIKTAHTVEANKNIEIWVIASFQLTIYRSSSWNR